MALEQNIINYNNTAWVAGIPVQKYVSLVGTTDPVTLVVNEDEDVQVQILSIVLSSTDAAIFTVYTDDDVVVQKIAVGAYDAYKAHADRSVRPLMAGNLGAGLTIVPSVSIEDGGIYIQYMTLTRA